MAGQAESLPYMELADVEVWVDCGWISTARRTSCFRQSMKWANRRRRASCGNARCRFLGICAALDIDFVQGFDVLGDKGDGHDEHFFYAFVAKLFEGGDEAKARSHLAGPTLLWKQSMCVRGQLANCFAPFSLTRRTVSSIWRG